MGVVSSRGSVKKKRTGENPSCRVSFCMHELVSYRKLCGKLCLVDDPDPRFTRIIWTC